MDCCDYCRVEKLGFVSWESWWSIEKHIGGALTRSELESRISKVGLGVITTLKDPDLEGGKTYWTTCACENDKIILLKEKKWIH